MLKRYLRYGNDYPYRGYGGNFFHWLQTEEKLPYNSFGNERDEGGAQVGMGSQHAGSPP